MQDSYHAELGGSRASECGARDWNALKQRKT